MSHGYGLSVTPLQPAHAYATVGSYGVARPVSFLRVEGAAGGEHALDEHVCRELITMLESVVTAEGTGKLAAIPGYRVSGKTGTAFKAEAGGYSTDRYMAVWGGVAPATAPRLAAGGGDGGADPRQDQGRPGGRPGVLAHRRRR